MRYSCPEILISLDLTLPFHWSTPQQYISITFTVPLKGLIGFYQVLIGLMQAGPGVLTLKGRLSDLFATPNRK